MLAYDKTLLKNTILKDETNSLLEAGLILKEQKEFIDVHLPSYNKQNMVVRIGLFILGCLFYTSCCGLFSFITSVGKNDTYGYTFFLYAAFGFLILEFVIHKWKYFANGLDDAFLFCAQICLITGIGFSMKDGALSGPLYLMTAFIGSCCCIRYADRFSAFLACLGITTFIIRMCLLAGDTTKVLLPFTVMLLAFCLYRNYLWLQKRTKLNSVYTNSLKVYFVFSGFLFYLGGNYFVVREASRELMHVYPALGEDIPLAFIFYGLTFLIPLLYIYFSLKKKSCILFR